MDDENDEIYEVEALLDHRLSKRTKKTLQYLIKWKNYDDSNNTWEEESNILSKELLDAYWEKQPMSRVASLALAKANQENKIASIQNKNRGSIRKPNYSAPSAITTDKVAKSQRNSVIVNNEPPADMTWSDVKAIVNVFKDTDGNLLADVQWSDGQRTSCHAKVLRTKCPDQLIEFYEEHLQFTP